MDLGRATVTGARHRGHSFLLAGFTSKLASCREVHALGGLPMVDLNFRAAINLNERHSLCARNRAATLSDFGRNGVGRTFSGRGAISWLDTYVAAPGFWRKNSYWIRTRLRQHIVSCLNCVSAFDGSRQAR